MSMYLTQKLCNSTQLSLIGGQFACYTIPHISVACQTLYGVSKRNMYHFSLTTIIKLHHLQCINWLSRCCSNILKLLCTIWAQSTWNWQKYGKIPVLNYTPECCLHYDCHGHCINSHCNTPACVRVFFC